MAVFESKYLPVSIETRAFAHRSEEKILCSPHILLPLPVEHSASLEPSFCKQGDAPPREETPPPPRVSVEGGARLGVGRPQCTQGPPTALPSFPRGCSRALPCATFAEINSFAPLQKISQGCFNLQTVALNEISQLHLKT